MSSKDLYRNPRGFFHKPLQHKGLRSLFVLVLFVIHGSIASCFKDNLRVQTALALNAARFLALIKALAIVASIPSFVSSRQATRSTVTQA